MSHVVKMERQPNSAGRANIFASSGPAPYQRPGPLATTTSTPRRTRTGLGSPYDNEPLADSNLFGNSYGHGYSNGNEIENGGDGGGGNAPMAHSRKHSNGFGNIVVNDQDSTTASPTGEPERKRQKRNKPTLSCFECVERKTKCDRGRPHCLACIKRQTECKYAHVANLLE
ncbi:hypothetical protein B0T22DRAFT_147225 [Podospora appendiculata]|uniref:Zn(2)-C6 fungal-type domain-containing protein n=1 Tax=Podospora appendiculata TaxID=314037 RepID=A0AAE0X978_9PEZI|nr:hypothetical protein B0T22DRAFT_147225 [Podospora appendiculata]